MLTDAGFEQVDVDPWRIYDLAQAHAFLTEAGVDPETVAAAGQGKFASAFIRATKPAARGCCGPECCS